MKARLNDFQALIRGEEHAKEAKRDPLFERMANATRTVGHPDRVGPADLAALIRQVLLREWIVDAPPILIIPSSDGWPSVRLWEEFGCSCAPRGDGSVYVTPKRWVPNWLRAGDVEAVDAACREEPRRTREPVPADPVVTDLVPSIDGKYASAGQRESVRAPFIAPEGTTVVICLPTGAGKTLAFQVPALQGIEQKRLVVVIVPTVALARDQERRFQELLERNARHQVLASKPLAYHSGLTKEDRRALFEGIREGTVPIVFTSPEAALGALRRPLLAAAEAGRIALFAVDEAHMVSQWGDSFRPEFQLVAGLRDELKRRAHTAGHNLFPTMLLTATLTAEGAVTLRQAFAPDGGFHVVAEPMLREEPAILVAKAPDEATRQSRVLEALRHLPRPLILYATKPDDALRWSELLRNQSYRRVRVVKGGDMATQYGEGVLSAWTRRELDIVVATSAFGLGVDQTDVRAVIHACHPESLDRYYQEVGRSGRDGAASLALLVPTQGDVPVAESLATNPSISVKRGLERWLRMFHLRRVNRTAPSGTIIVPLEAVPPGVRYSSDLNVAWNQRTLVLMARSGLIRFACVPPPECVEEEGEAPEDFEKRRREAFEVDARTSAVQIEDPDHMEESTWKARVEPLRQWLAEQDRRTIGQMDDLISGGNCPADLFRGVYTVEELGIYPPAPGFATAVVFLQDTSCRLGPELQALLETSSTDGRLFVEYSIPGDFLALRRWRSDLGRTLERLARSGVIEFSIASDLVEPKAWKALADRSPVHFACLVEDTGTSDTRTRPRVTVLGAGATAEKVRAVLEVERDQHFILFPTGAPDPFNPPRRLRDTHTSMSLETFAGRLTF